MGIPVNALGAGFCSYGAAVYGYGSPASVGPYLNSVGQGGQGAQYGSRQIDDRPGTRGRYVVDPATGRAVGDRDVRQMVLIALRTRAGSSAVSGLGESVSSIRKIGDGFASQVDSAVRAALAQLVKDGWIRVDSVAVETSGQRSNTVVRITDLTTGKPLPVVL